MPRAPMITPDAKAGSKSTSRSKAAARQPALAKELNKSGADALAPSVRIISVGERERLVAQAAYFRAEKRGFAPGYEMEDWVEAEAEVLRLIGR